MVGLLSNGVPICKLICFQMLSNLRTYVSKILLFRLFVNYKSDKKWCRNDFWAHSENKLLRILFLWTRGAARQKFKRGGYLKCRNHSKTWSSQSYVSDDNYNKPFCRWKTRTVFTRITYVKSKFFAIKAQRFSVKLCSAGKNCLQANIMRNCVIYHNLEIE